MTDERSTPGDPGVIKPKEYDITDEERAAWSRAVLTIINEGADEARQSGAYPYASADVEELRDDGGEYSISIHPSFVDTYMRPQLVTVNLYKDGVHVQMMNSLFQYDPTGEARLIAVNNTALNDFSEDKCLAVLEAGIYASLVTVSSANAEQQLAEGKSGEGIAVFDGDKPVAIPGSFAPNTSGRLN